LARLLNVFMIIGEANTFQISLRPSCLRTAST
jgi:hypothetical protein